MSERKPFPWEIAASTHAEKVAELEAAWRSLKAQKEQARRDMSRASYELQQHLTALLNAEDIPAWAKMRRELEDVAAAYAEILQLIEPLVGAAERRYKSVYQDDPASRVRVEHIERLRDIMGNSQASRSQKEKAFKELEAIEEAERVKVIVTSPPGFNERDYRNGILLKQ